MEGPETRETRDVRDGGDVRYEPPQRAGPESEVAPETRRETLWGSLAGTAESVRGLPSAARWVLAGVLAFALLLLLGKCYGDARAEEASKAASAAAQVEAARTATVTFAAFRDSALRQITAANARADSAEARAFRAEQRSLAAEQTAVAAQQAYRALPPQVVASLPPEVQRVLTDLQTSNAQLITTQAELRSSVAELRGSNDSLRVAAMSARAALDRADTALARKDSAIAALVAIKTPRKGFLHYAGEVAKAAAYLGGGIVIGKALR